MGGAELEAAARGRERGGGSLEGVEYHDTKGAPTRHWQGRWMANPTSTILYKPD